MPPRRLTSTAATLCLVASFAWPGWFQGVAAGAVPLPASGDAATVPALAEAVAPGAVTPDTVPPAWLAGLWYEREVIRSDLPGWSDWTGLRVSAMRDLRRGALGLELFRAERFGLRDLGGSLDWYVELWERAYANVRLRVTPGADVLPGMDLRGELFQAWPGGWEVSGSGWWMDFPEHDAVVAGVGIARYLGSWYLRETVTLGTLAGESALSTSFLARRYLDPPREYLELSGGVGKEVVVLGAGPTVDVRDTRFLRWGLQKFLTRSWGVSAALQYHRFQGTPSRRGGSLGVLARF
jgi:YaiO family outer membrane protein